MELVRGQEYTIKHHGKIVKATFLAKGGNESAGFESNAFKLKRKQKFNIHGDNYPLQTLSHIFIHTDKLEESIIS